MAGRWLGVDWENTCCIRTPDTNKKQQSVQQTTIQYTQNQHQMAGWLVVAISDKSGEHLNRREMAGRWLGDGWVVAPGYFQRLRVYLFIAAR